MNNKLVNFIMFVAGAGIGSAATWYLIKEKYAKLAREEVAAAKEVWRDSRKAHDDLAEKYDDLVAKYEMAKYHEVTEKYNYNKLTQNKEEALEEVDDMSGPYVIPPEVFDDAGYEIVSLTYYADGVVADSISDEIIDEPHDLVGEFEDHFGEYEDDSVFVRNDDERVDYEILLDGRRYSDVAGRKYSNVANQDFD